MPAEELELLEENREQIKQLVKEEARLAYEITNELREEDPAVAEFIGPSSTLTKVDDALKWLREKAKKSEGQQPDSTGESDLKTRVVEEGDTLWDIAAEEYGDPTKWPVIADANDIDNPRNLEVGTTLVIPE